MPNFGAGPTFLHIFLVYTVDVYANFNLESGQVASSNGVISPTITPWGNDGWYRCTMTYSVANMSTFAISIISSDTSIKGVTNTLATNIYVAGVQIEEGSFATSYTPTTNIVTRAADVYTPRPAWEVTLVSGDVINDDFQIKFSIWRQGGKLDIGSGYSVPLNMAFRANSRYENAVCLCRRYCGRCESIYDGQKQGRFSIERRGYGDRTAG